MSSATGCATSRKRWSTWAPAPWSPVQHDTTVRNGSPTRFSGMIGSGGAKCQEGNPPYSRGAPAMKSRKYRRTSAASSHSNSMSPAKISPTGWRRNSNSVTTPKFPPPPRSAQNRSGYSVSLAVVMWPSARTTSADSKLSQDRPRARQIPDPAAEGEAGDASGRHDAARGRQPMGGRGVVHYGPGGPAPDARRPPLRIDQHPVQRRQVGHDGAVAGAEPGDAVPSAPDGEVAAAVTGVVHHRPDIAGVGAADDDRRMPVDHEVVDAPGILVIGVAGSDHLAGYVVGQRGHRCHGVLRVGLG